jgi:hypothetical protein
MKKMLIPNMLNTLSGALIVIGAAGSLYFVLHAGRHNNSLLLRMLFVAWVISPFIALLIGNSFSRYRSFFARRIFYVLMLFVTIGALIIYTGVLGPMGTKPAAVFLMVPLISWLLIAVVILISRSRSN